MRISKATYWLIAASTILVLAAWPSFVSHGVAAARAPLAPPSEATPAPAPADYRYRDRTIAQFELSMQRDRDNQIIARMLAADYLQRYRERGDLSDVQRADSLAHRSLQLQPQRNTGAELTLAAVLATYHAFRPALRYARAAYQTTPWNSQAGAQVATLYMEIGEYAQAQRTLARIPRSPYEDAAVDTARARYDELTGNLAAARLELQRALVQQDSMVDNGAEARAWYHVRAGELAFEAGDLTAAEHEHARALELFPTYARAFSALARIYCAQHRWREALAAATRSADLVPQPETLGYKYDAQRALGEGTGAAATAALIDAVARIGNTRGVNDRLLAVFYSEHRLHIAEALRIARRELAVRDDIYAEDTLAWAAAIAGQWDEARRAAARAIRYGTQDSRLQFHAGMIALHFGEREEARTRLEMALRLNRRFHPLYAEQAQHALAALAHP